jgi:hypothetical protein
MSSNNSNNNSVIAPKRDGVLFLLLLSASPEVCESFGTATATNSRSLSVTSPSPHKKRRSASSAAGHHRHEPASSSRVVLNSFEYLGNLWKDEDYGDATTATSNAVATTTTAFAEPPMLEFQPLPQPQAPQQPLTYYADDFYYDNGSSSNNNLFPALPAPPPVMIANPYDMTPVAQASVVTETNKGVDFQSLRDAAAEIIPSVVAAIPRPDVRSLASTLTRIQPMQQTKPKIKVPEPEKKPSIIQGKSIRTWNLLQQTSATTTMMQTQEDQVKSVEVSLSTNGRPLNAEIELWQGPDHAPQKIAVYSEDGKARPLRTVVVATSPQTTGGVTSHIRSSTTVAVKNSAEMEFPLSAECKEAVDANYGNNMKRTNEREDWNRNRRGNNRYNNNRNNEQVSIVPHKERLMWQTKATSKVTTATKTVQGGASTVLPAFPSSVRSVQVFITNEDGVPVNARVEVLQGPNNIKQLIEVFCEDGKLRPFGAILELPSGNNDGSIADMGLDHVLRVVNTGPLEFPFEVRVEPYSLDGEDTEEEDDDYYGSGVGRDFYYFDSSSSSNTLNDVRNGGAFALNDYSNPNKAYFLN